MNATGKQLTGAPGKAIPDEWDAIPGARGWIPQAGDEVGELHKLGVKIIFGVSTQDAPYQQELKLRVHLPYELLSDADLKSTETLRLPTSKSQGKKPVKRLALAVENGQIIKAWCLVFDPYVNTKEVTAWLPTKN